MNVEAAEKSEKEIMVGLAGKVMGTYYLFNSQGACQSYTHTVFVICICTYTYYIHDHINAGEPNIYFCLVPNRFKEELNKLKWGRGRGAAGTYTGQENGASYIYIYIYNINAIMLL